jgi:integrase
MLGSDWRTLFPQIVWVNSMHLSTIIPQFLLPERHLLAVYCFLLRIVKPNSCKQLVDGMIVALRPYEACVHVSVTASELRIEEAEVISAIKTLTELELIDNEILNQTIKIRFKYLVLPSTENVKSTDAVIDGNDCWFDEFVPEYLQYIQTNMSPRTYENYEAIVTAFSKWLGRKKMNELSTADLEGYKNKRKGLVSDQTINIHIRTLKAAMEVATKLKKIQDNPFRSVKLIRVPQKATPSLTKAQYVTLIKTVQEPWLIDIIGFDILTGLRLGELVNLRWSDVDLNKCVITIQSTPNYQVKHGKMRVLPLHSEAITILSRKEKAGEWVFLKDDHARPSCQFISKKFKAYSRAAGLPEEMHFHSLRATFASWCANNGVSLYTLQNLMGHSSISVTESYATPDQRNILKELSKISLENDSRGPA